jgi:hypothetical protein
MAILLFAKIIMWIPAVTSIRVATPAISTAAGMVAFILYTAIGVDAIRWNIG